MPARRRVVGQRRAVAVTLDTFASSSFATSSFATSLRLNCPISGGDNNLASLDVLTSIRFDNGFYKNLMKKKGLLHSDQQLFSGYFIDSIVSSYATDYFKFFRDFATAMVKMGKISPLTGRSGEIRSNCRKTNK